MFDPERHIPACHRGRDLYEPATEHDACGIGFLCNIDGRPSHQIVRDGFRILSI